jgi:hypothetical protein
MFVAKPPSISQLADKIGLAEVRAALAARVDFRSGDRYLHWDKLQRLPPPDGLSSEQWWLRIKLSREGELRELPLTDPDGNPFRYGVLDSMLRHLHYIDQRCSGEVAMD